MYSIDEIKTYVQEEDVKFIRLAFCDINGKQKTLSITLNELDRAFTHGISFDASKIEGFDCGDTDLYLYLHPCPSTLSVLPWRPQSGRVVRMYCDIRYMNGEIFEKDNRYILKSTTEEAKNKGYTLNFATEYKFYLFKRDENGEPTKIPFDYAGYMDIAPDDKGENIRREICLTLSEMGIYPEISYHEAGPGQNQINFKYSDPLNAADNAVTFKTVVNTIATRNGLYADFSSRPLKDKTENDMTINISSDILSSTELKNRLSKHDCLYSSIHEHENKVKLSTIDSTVNPYTAFALLIKSIIE
jgi:Glutamine synthetase